MRNIRTLGFIVAMLSGNACSRSQEELQFSSECVAYLQISYRADPSADKKAIPAALKRAHDQARALSRSHTGGDEKMGEYASNAVLQMSQRFGTDGKDSPELVSFLRTKTAACLKRYLPSSNAGS